jgi:GntR family transcriptional regulator, vanillate catabolism transcriptional regulator
LFYAKSANFFRNFGFNVYNPYASSTSFLTMPTPVNPSANDNPSNSQAVRAQLRLREMILAAELPAGARIAELTLVDKLGVSRTPIRTALMKLEQEGLLESLANGGYAVRTFTERDVSDAIELRGTLEGLAARLAAERGCAPVLLTEARQGLAQIDQLLSVDSLNEEAFSAYVDQNEKFHALLQEMAGSDVLRREWERVVGLPFASPSGFVLSQAHTSQSRDMLIVAQDQHRQVLQAIEQREGARAEAIMREHSRLAQRNLSDAMRNTDLNQLPGVRLIRRRH